MTDLDIVNKALLLIGVEPIGSLKDHSKTARVMSALLPETKRVVLNEFPWTFALRIVPLTKKTGVTVSGYEYFYSFPSDALNVQRVYNDTGYRGIAEYRVVNNTIATHIASGSLEYTAYVDDVTQWPAQVLECLVNRLASDAATSLTGQPQLATALLQKYMTLASHAAQVSVTEENIPPMRAADHNHYVQARSSGGD